MTKEITQEETEAYTKSIMDALKDKEVEKVVMEKDVRDCILKANCDLVAENQRLKKQLDKEIHINRKMKSCLSAFARRDNWKAIEGCADWLFLLDPLMAEETLKEIDNKE